MFLKKKSLFKTLVAFVVLLIFSIPQSFGQSCACDATVPIVTVDLSSRSDTIWSWNSTVKRQDYCCSSPSGQECIKFIVIIHPQTEEVSFDVTTPGPSGGAFYKIDCGTSHSLSEKVCVNGTTTFCITYCKNGADKPTYWISAGRKTSISADITLRPGCSDTISAAGYTSVIWTSVYPGTAGQYNSYLSSTTSADVLVTAPNPIPSGVSYIDYKVSGTAAGCSSGITTDTVRVYFTSATLNASINPALPAICAGGAPVTLTASGTGGSSPYTYAWSTGAISSSISVASAGTFTVTISDATPCAAVSTSVDVIQFTSTITAEAGSNQTVCSTSPAVILAGSVGGVTTGQWSGGTGVFTPNNTTLNATYTPSAAEITAGTVTLTLTTTNNRTCPSANDNMSITINHAPVATATPSSQTLCSGVATSIVLTSTITGSTYSWTVSQSAGISGASNSSGSTIAQTLTNSGTTNGTATYTITPAANGCTGSAITVIITVKPIPVATATPASQTICSTNATNVALTSNVSGTTFAWTVAQANVTGASNSSGSTIAQTLTASLTTAGTATYTVTPTANSCSGLAISIPVTVNPNPAATATPASQTICSGSAPSIALTSNVTGTTFTWTVAQDAGITGGSASSGAAIAQTLSNSGTSAGTATYTVTPTANSCSGSIINVVIAVNPLPATTASPASQTVCSESAPSIALTSDVTGTTFTWTVAQDAGITGGSASSGAAIAQALSNSTISAANATYTVTPTANSCSGSTTNVVITVNPVPSIATTTPDSRCGTGTVTLGATSNIGTVYWYAASSGGASLGAGISYTTAAIASTTTYYVDATLNGCTTASRTAVVATIFTIPSISSTTPGSRCGTGTVSLGATASAGTVNWYAASSGGASLGTGTNYTTPSISVNTSYYVDATDNGCATASRTAVLATVYTVPTIATTTPSSRCDAGAVTLGATASAGTVNWYTASSGEASLGTGTSYTTPSISSTTTYYVDATSNGCTTSGRTSVIATIYTTPNISSTTSGSRCDAGTVTLGATPSSGTVNWYAASSGGASLGAGNSFTTGAISATTTYYADVTDNGCTTSSRTAVVATVYTTPTITAITPGSRCGTGTASLSAAASTGTINWYAVSSGGASLGTGTSFTTPSISSTTNYYVDATSNGCTTSGRTSITATVYQTPTTTATPASEIICSGGTSNIALTSDVGGSTFIWTVSQGSGISGGSASNGSTIAQTLINSGTSSGIATYTVTPTANGCAGSTISVDVTVNPLPSVITAPASQTVCSGSVTSIALTSNVSGTTFAWTVSQGAGITGGSASSGASIAQILSNSGTSAGTATYTITPTASSCAGSTTNVVITVNPLPSATATPASQTICSGSATNIALSSNVSGTDFTWTVSQGAGITGGTANSGATIAQTLSNSGTSAGAATYTVTPSANSCAGATTSVVATVRPLPIATANPSSQTICNSITTNIALTSNVSGTTFAWTVSQDAGITGGSSSSGATIAQTLLNSGTSAGTATYTITPTANNCSGSTSNIVITVSPTPSVTATPALQTICNGNAPSIALTSNVSGTTFAWTVSQSSGITGASSSNGLTIAQTLSNSGTTAGTATYTVTPTANSCAGSTTSVIITVNPSPSATATPVSQTVCSLNATSIALTSNVSGATFAWTVSQDAGITGGSAGNGATIAQTLSNSGTSNGTATYTVTPTANNCAGSSISVLITVKPIPVVTATPSSQSICNGSATSISLTSNVSGSTFAWTVTQSGVTGATASTGSSIAQTLSLSGIVAGTVTYAIIPTASSCSGSFVDVSIAVNPIPSIATTTPASRCGTGTVILAATSSNGTVYWYAASSGGSSLGSGTNYTTASISSTTTYYVNASANGCTTALRTSVVATVDPVPTVNAGTDQTVCVNNAVVTLSGSKTNATGATWSSNGTGTFDNITNLSTTYIPSGLDKTNGNVTITLTTSGSGSCAAVTDQMIITITTAPTVDAGDGQTVCANSSDATLSGVVIISSGGQWSGGTGTYNPNNNTLSAVYTPSAAEITAGTVTLTLTSTGNGTCIAVTDQTTITINTGIYVNANSDQIVCANNAIVTLAGSVTGSTTTGLWTTSGTGTFSDASSLTSTYSPSVNDKIAGTVTLTLTSTNNGLCSSVSDAMVITITTVPTAEAGSPQSICANNATATLAGSITVATGGQWSGGNGTYNPNSTTLAAVYTPSAAEIIAGTVTLVLTTTGNGSCIAVTDQITLTITSSPTVNAGVDQSLCASTASVNISGTETVATGGHWTTSGTGTFTDANAVSTTYTPSVADKTTGVTLTLSTTGNGTCIAVSDVLALIFQSVPTAEAGNAQTVCNNNDAVALAGSVTGATGGTWSGGTGTYNPNNTTLNAIYTPSAAEKTAGTVTLTLTSTGNGLCVAGTDQMTITITSGPTANTGIDQTVCANNAVVTLSSSVTVATGGTWTTSGSGTFGNANSLNTTYTPSTGDKTIGSVFLYLTTTGNGLCIASKDTMLVIITTAPTANAGNDKTVCATNSNTFLAGIITIATGGTWSGGTGTYNPGNTTLSTTYSPSAAEITAGTVTLILTTTGNGSCIAVTDQMTITITTGLTVNAGTDQIVCSQSPNVSLNGTVPTTGIWTTSGTGNFNPDATTLTATYEPSAADTTALGVDLTITSTNNGGCAAANDVMHLTINNGIYVEAGSNQTVCSSAANVNVFGSVTGATGGQWASSGTGTFANSTSLSTTYSPSSADKTTGSITITLNSTGNGSCSAVSDNFTLTIQPVPTATAGIAQTVCANNATVTLSGSKTGATGNTWSTGGDGTFGNINNLSTTYTSGATDISNNAVTLTLTTTGNGVCAAATSNLLVTITNAPTVNAGLNISVCSNAPNTTLNGTVTIATGGIWTSNGTGTFSPNATMLSATYVPSVNDTTIGTVILTLTSTGNGTCLSVNDNTVLSYTMGIYVNAGINQSVCANNAVTTIAGTVRGATMTGTWTSSGSGSFANVNNLNTTYTPTSADKTAGSVLLILTSTNNGTCNEVKDTMLLTITSSPSVNAGSNQTVCSNNSVTLAGSVSQGATTGQWTTLGSGSFANSTNLGTTYTLHTNDITAGQTNLVLTSTANGTCIAVTDTMTVTIQTRPTVSAGPDQTKCRNNDTIQLAGSIAGITTTGVWTSNGTGSFVPNTTSMNSKYFPSTTDRNNGTVTLALTSTNNSSCTAVNDAMIVTITPAVNVSAGADQSRCSNNPNAILSGTITGGSTTGQWTSTGTGIFNPDATTLAATYIPSDADTAIGSLTLILTATNVGSCLSAVDNMVFTITNSPIVNAGIDQTVCSNNDTISLAGAVSGGVSTGLWSTTGTGTFSPNTTTMGASYRPSVADTAAGSIQFTLTSTNNGGCIAVTDNMILNITNAPFVDAGNSQTVCSNNAFVNIIGTIYGATATGTWTSNGTGVFGDANTLSTSYTPSTADTASGSVLLTLTTTGNGTCYTRIDTTRITITNSPIVNAGSNQTICSNNTASLSGAVSGGSTTGQWTSSGTGIFANSTSLSNTFTPSAADTALGSVTITLTSTNNGGCIAVTDDLSVIIQNLPIVNAGPDQVACRNNDIITLAGSIYGVTSTGTWTSSGTGTFAPNTTTMNATYTPSNADRNAGFVTLTLTSTNNSSCSAVSDAMLFAITTAVTVSAGANQSKCSNNPNAILSGSVSGGSTTGIWITSGSGTFNPDETTLTATYIPSDADTTSGSVTLTLTATNFGSCLSSSDLMVLTITNAPIVNAGTDQTVCSNKDTISLAGSVGGGVSTGLWTTNGTGTFSPNAITMSAIYYPSVADTAAGSIQFTLTSTNNGGCIAVTDNMTLIITNAPYIDAGNAQTVCANNSIINIGGTIFGATTSGIWTSSGTGAFGDASTLNTTYTPSNADKTSGNVLLSLTTTGNGTCYSKTDTSRITITSSPVVNAGNDQTICSNNTSSLSGTVNGGSTTGLWSGLGTGTFTNSASLITTYTPSTADTAAGMILLILTSTNNNNCLAVSDTMQIIFNRNPTVIANQDQTVCAFNDTVSINGTVSGITTTGIWSSTGNGIFVPGNTSLSAIYIPGNNDRLTGLATLTLTSTNNQTCIASSDFITLTITPSVSVNAGTNQSVCANNPVASINGNITGGSTTGIWTSNGSGMFGSANSPATTYTPSSADTAAGSVFLYLSATNIGSCLPARDTIALTISNIPIADAGIDKTICANNDTVTLFGSVSAGSTTGLWTSSGSGIFVPNTTALTANYIPSTADTASGTFEIYLTSTNNGGCLAVKDTILITITNAPYVNAGIDQTVCANNAEISLSGSIYGASATGTWTSTGVGSFTNANMANTAYTPDNAEIASGSIKLVLTPSNIGNCISITDTILVTFSPSPIVVAGSDISVCSNNTIGLAGVVSVSTTTGLWSSSGTGTFYPNAYELNAVYTPSSQDTIDGNIGMVLTSTNNGNCIAVTDTLLVQFITAPVITAGPNQTVCAFNDTIHLNGTLTGYTHYGFWETSGSGSFIPTDTILTTTYLPSIADRNSGSVTLRIMSTHNPYCTPVSDSLTITITAPITANAGSDKSVCSNNPVVNITGNVAGGSTTGIWSTNGSGTFSPNDTLMSISYIPSNADTADGSIILTLSSTNNGNCLAATDQMILTITNSPIVQAGTDQSVCANKDTVQLAGLVHAGSSTGLWTTSGTGNFVTNNTSLTGKYIPSNADTAIGTVTLVLTSTNNGGCNAVSDTLIITITDAPFVFAGADTTVCGLEGSTTLGGIVYGGSASGLWSSSGTGTFANNTTLNTIYTFSNADTSQHQVSLILSSNNNGNCKAVVDTIKIIITPRTYVNAGADKIICATNLNVPVSGSVYGSSHAGIWTSTGSGTFTNATSLNTIYNITPADTMAGIVYLILTSTGNGLCDIASDTMKITINPGIYVYSGSDQITCANNVNINLTGNVAGISATGIWTTTGQGSFNPNNTTLNTQYVPDTADVSAGSVTFILTSTNNGSCSAVTDTMLLTITPSPIVDIGADLFICKNNPVAALNATISAGSTTGQWTTTGTGILAPSDTSLNITYTPSIQDSIAGSVILYLASTNNGDCIAGHDTITITYTESPVVFAGSDTNICASNSLQLLGTVQFGAGTGEWESTGNGTFSPSNTILNATYHFSSDDINTGTVNLILKATNVTGCNLVTDSIKVTIYPGPIVEAGADITVCANNDSVQLAGMVSGSTTTGKWISSGTGIFLPDTTVLNAVYIPSNIDTTNGSVILHLYSTNNAGCNIVQDSLIITITSPPVVNAGQDQVICKGLSASLNGTVSGATTTAIWTTMGSGTFSPSDTSLSATYIPSSSDTAQNSVSFTLFSTDNGNCNVVSDQITVQLVQSPVVNAGTDITTCANNVTVNLIGSVVSITSTGKWTTTGSGIFSPSNTNMTTSYIPSAADVSAGFANLILSSTNTCVYTDTLHLTISPAPSVNAGLDQIVCINQNTIQLSGSATGGTTTGIWTTSGTGAFVPNDTTLNANYIRSAQDSISGQISFWLSSTNFGNCLPVSDDMVLTFTTIPVVEAGQNFTFCANNANVALHGLVNGGTSTGIWTTSGNGTFAPNATTLLATYNPGLQDLSNGSATLTLTSTGACITLSDSVIYTFTPPPVVDAGSDLSVCANNPNITISGSVSGITTTGHWYSNGNGTFTPNAASLNSSYTPTSTDIASGSIELTLASTSNGMCYPAMDTVIVTITPSPTVNAGNDAYICKGNNVILIGSVTGGAATGQWATTGTGIFNPDNTTLNTTYIPSSSDTLTGIVSFVLTSTNNGNCLALSDNKLITFTTKPYVNAGTDNTVCANNASVSLNGIVSGSSTTGQWNSSGNGTFTPLATSLNGTFIPGTNEINAGFATLYLSSTNSCLIQDSITITITNAPSVDAGDDQYYCVNNPVVPLNGTIGNGTSSGKWTTSGSGTFVPNDTLLSTAYTPSNSDTLSGSIVITLTSTNNGSCAEVKDSLKVHFIEYPVVEAGPDTTYCGNCYVILDGSIQGGFTSGNWTTPGTGQFDPDAIQLYTTYHFSALDTASNSLEFTLSSPDYDGCPTVSDSLTVSISPAPNAIASGDVSVCANNNTVTLNGTVSGPTNTGVWITSGSGIFIPNDSTLNVTYIPSETDNDSEGVMIFLRSTHNGICFFDQDTVIVTILPSPNVNVGADQFVCNGSNVNLPGSITGTTTTGIWTTTGTGTFSPNSTSLNAVYIPSSNDTILGTIRLELTATNVGTCLAASDTMFVSFTAEPLVEAGSDYVVCANNGTFFLNGIVSGSTTTGRWITNGNGTFMPDSATLNAQYIPGINDIATGHATLTLQSTNACLIQDSLVVTITPAPNINAGSDKIVCYGSNTIQLTASVTGGASSGNWSTTGTGTFTPNSASLNATYHITAQDSITGVFYLILTSTNNGNCVAEDDSVRVSFSTIPLVTVGPDIIACANTDLELTGSVTGGNNTGQWTTSGSGTFVPSDTSLNATYIFSYADTTAGNISLQLTATNACVAIKDTIYVTITPAPAIIAWVENAVCANNPDIQLNSSVMVASGLTWVSSSGGSFIPNDSALMPQYTLSPIDINNGSVKYIITTTGNGNCNPTIDTLTVNISPQPVVDAGTNQIVCFENLLVVFNGSVTGGSTTGIWTSNGTGTFVPNNSTLNAVYMPSSTDTAGGYLQFILTSTNNGSCMSVSDTMFVIFTERPVVTVIDSVDICAGITFVNISGSVTGSTTTGIWASSGGGSFTPSDTSLNAVYNISLLDISNGYATLKLTATNGCLPVSDSLFIKIRPLPVAGFKDTANCNSLMVSFTDTSTISAGTINSYNWTFGDGITDSIQNPNYLYETADSFAVSLIVASEYSCKDTVTRTIGLASVTAEFTNDAGCLYDSVKFTSISNFQNCDIISTEWNFGDNSMSIITDPAHLYQTSNSYNVSLIVFTNIGCSDTVTHSIIINPVPAADFIWDKMKPTSFENIAFIDSSKGANFWAWDFGDQSATVTEQNPSHSYNDLGVYDIKLIVSNNFSCYDTLIKPLTVEGTLGPKLPAAFTPNNDGINDYLRVRGGPFKSFAFNIYNEWGKLVYQSSNSLEAWDGKYKGKDQTNGVYIYIIRAEMYDGTVYNLHGDITLIR